MSPQNCYQKLRELYLPRILLFGGLRYAQLDKDSPDKQGCCTFRVVHERTIDIELDLIFISVSGQVSLPTTTLMLLIFYAQQNRPFRNFSASQIFSPDLKTYKLCA